MITRIGRCNHPVVWEAFFREGERNVIPATFTIMSFPQCFWAGIHNMQDMDSCQMHAGMTKKKWNKNSMFEKELSEIKKWPLPHIKDS